MKKIIYKAASLALSLVFLFGGKIYASDGVIEKNIDVRSRLYELLSGERREEDGERVYLIPGGQVFGTRVKEARLTVSEVGDAKGLSVGDKIIAINDRDIRCLDDIKDALREGGESCRITVMRDGRERSLDISPHLVGDEYKLGCTVRDGVAGIGTLTYIEPQTGKFGGLGHGIYDSGSDTPIDLRSGEVTGVILGAVEKGEAGDPGELSGILTDKVLGEIYSNTDAGVFGRLNLVDKEAETLPVAHRSEVKDGEARIISTLRCGKTLDFKVELHDVNQSSEGTKSFKVHVTDPALIAISGGIVRGMSGSPIIQNGKLVGAVTHVMINDPTVGYGIFIENMLNASESARNELPKAA